MSTPTPGWYDDPADARQLRWWDGYEWAAQTLPAEQAGPATGAASSVSTTTSPYGADSAGFATAGPADPPVGVWRSPIDNRPIVPDMWTALRVFFAKYAQFDGRASRSEFWYLVLALGLTYLAVLVLMLVPIIGMLALLGVIAGGLAILVPSVAVTVRRLRDAGWHWAWMFLGLVPGGSIALIVFCAMPSKYP